MYAVIRDDWWIAAPASDGRRNPLCAGRGHAVACPRARVRLGVAVMGLGVIARVTVTAPAMEAGVTDRLWEIADIAKLVEDAEPKAGERGPYRKRMA